MIPGPIFEREMLVAFRRPRTYVAWGIFLLALFAVLFLLWPVDPRAARASLAEVPVKARAIFSYLAFLQFVAVGLMAPAYAAGAFTAEKESRTLGLLLLSETGAWEIVLGKAFFRVFQTGALMTLALPMFMALLAIGGITLGEMVMVYGVSLGLAILGTGVGVLASAVAARGYLAVFLAYIILGALLAAAPLAGLAGGPSTPLGTGLGAWERHLSPLDAFRYIFEPRAYGDLFVVRWWVNPILATGVGAVCVAAAALLLPRAAVERRKAADVTAAGTGPVGGGALPRWLRAGVARNPFFYRDSRAGLLGRRVPQTFLYVLALAAVGGGGYLARGALSDIGVQMVVTPVLVGVVCLASSVLGATSIGREREEATLEMLAATPVDPDSYLLGRAFGVASSVGPIAIVPIAHTALWSALGVLPWYIPAMHVLLVASSLALYTMEGLYWSFKSPSSVRAVVMAIGTAVLHSAACCPAVVSWGGSIAVLSAEATLATDLIVAALVAVGFVIPYAIYQHLSIRFDELIGRTG